MPQQIRNFYVALRDMAPYVQDPMFLTQGKRFSNFNMLVREAWANWLLCVVLRHVEGRDFTFMEDDGGDGIICDKGTGFRFSAEHVCALDFPGNAKQPPKNEARAISAIEHKAKRGESHAKGKTLVVFLDGAEIWYPNRVGRVVAGRHNFNEIYCVGLLLIDEQGYSYSISKLHKDHSPTWRVQINLNFTDWKVTSLQ